MEPLDIIINDENKEELAKAIAALTQTEKLCLRLVEIEGVSYNDTAVMCGMTNDHVRHVVFETKQKLKKFLNDGTHLLLLVTSLPLYCIF